MGLQTTESPVVETLAGQQQVHAERSSDAADGDEEFGEVRMLTEHFGELVDDDEQRGQRREGGPACARRVVLTDVREVSRGPQHPLPAGHLSGKGVAHPRDQVRLLGQIGHDGRHVTEPFEAEEGGATLEVDQHQVQGVGSMRAGQARARASEGTPTCRIPWRRRTARAAPCHPEPPP